MSHSDTTTMFERELEQMIAKPADCEGGRGSQCCRSCKRAIFATDGVEASIAISDTKPPALQLAR